jgi:hypothetical protein
VSPPCTAIPLTEDDRVRITRFDCAPDAETGWQRHGHDHIITAITDCPMLLEEPGGGTRHVTVPAGTACTRKQGVEHDVVNDGAHPRPLSRWSSSRLLTACSESLPHRPQGRQASRTRAHRPPLPGRQP